MSSLTTGLPWCLEFALCPPGVCPLSSPHSGHNRLRRALPGENRNFKDLRIRLVSLLDAEIPFDIPSLLRQTESSARWPQGAHLLGHVQLRAAESLFAVRSRLRTSGNEERRTEGGRPEETTKMSRLE